MAIQFNHLFLAVLSSLAFIACKKTKPGTSEPPPPPGDTTIAPAIDPEIANTIGFFLDDWQGRSFTTPAYNETAIATVAGVTVTVNASDIITKIPRSSFGNNAVWWMGPITAQATTDVTNLHPHIIRFPGGNASNNYFWNALQDQKPADVPDTYFDKDGVSHPAGYNYGKTDHNWEFTLEQYYNMLQQTNNQGLITVNYGYARYSTATDPVASAAHLAADWVRYDNGRTKYWEIGNEHYGDWQLGYRIDLTKNKDGQPEIITGDLYGNHFKVFADSMKKAATEIGKTIYTGAVVHETASQSWETNTTKTWNAGVMTASENKADFYVAHNYITPYDQNSNASQIFTPALSTPAEMMNFIKQELQANGATVKPIAFDEWNMWAKDTKQQVSNASGVFALLVLGESIKSKYGMTGRWDMLNGWDNGNDHGMFSPGNEPGIAKWSPRPSFYYMYFFQKLLGDRMVSNTVSGSSNVVAYSSTYTSGQLNVTLLNTSAAAQTVEIKMKNFRLGSRFYWYTFQGGTDNGEFSRKVIINGSTTVTEAGGPLDYATLKANAAVTTGGIKVTVPPRGAVIMVIDKK